MSGSGRKSHYRKSVQDDFLHGFPIPEENDFICRAISSRGSNIFEIEQSDSKIELAILPNKFKKLIWIKRGDYVIATAAQDEKNSKIKYLIKNILNKDQIEHLVSQNLWPVEFVLESKKDEDYNGMPNNYEDDDYGYGYEDDNDDNDNDREEDEYENEYGYGNNLKVDSMGNTIEEDEEEEEEEEEEEGDDDDNNNK